MHWPMDIFTGAMARVWEFTECWINRKMQKNNCYYLWWRSNRVNVGINSCPAFYQTPETTSDSFIHLLKKRLLIVNWQFFLQAVAATSVTADKTVRGPVPSANDRDSEGGRTQEGIQRGLGMNSPLSAFAKSHGHHLKIYWLVFFPPKGTVHLCV